MTLKWHNDDTAVTQRWLSSDTTITQQWHSSETAVTQQWHSSDSALIQQWHSSDTAVLLVQQWNIGHSCNIYRLKQNCATKHFVFSCLSSKRSLGIAIRPGFNVKSKPVDSTIHWPASWVRIYKLILTEPSNSIEESNYWTWPCFNLKSYLHEMVDGYPCRTGIWIGTIEQ